jgi:hypothetical protein
MVCRYTLTLQTTDKIIIPAMQAQDVRLAVRQQLPVHLAKTLSSTSVSLGKTARDFVYLNFVSIESAAEALLHLNEALAGNVNLGGKIYKVKADWDKRTLGAHASAIEQVVVAPRPASAVVGVPSVSSNVPVQPHTVPVHGGLFFPPPSAACPRAAAPDAIAIAVPPAAAPSKGPSSKPKHTSLVQKSQEEHFMKIRDCLNEQSCIEHEMRSKWPGFKYCSVNKNKKVLRIGFHSQEALVSARSGVDAATFIIEPRTDAVHDENFVMEDFAERGFRPFLLSVSPMARRCFILRFVHTDIAASAKGYLQNHRLFQLKERSGAAALPDPRQPF